MGATGPGIREERRVVTAMFADLVGSTSLADRLDPEDYKLVVADVVARVVGAVEAFGGTIKDLAGDGVLALFGAPVAHEDDPERAVRAGMRAVEEIRATRGAPDSVVLLSPQGRTFRQAEAERLARVGHIVLLCGRYEGMDERVRDMVATEEISIGDYVLSGGELAALIVVDAVSRLVPGVVGDEQSVAGDSFTRGLLDYPHYTRPAEFEGSRVPEVLLSGHHAEIRRWRRQQALRRTWERRPDLLGSAQLDEEEQGWLRAWTSSAGPES